MALRAITGLAVHYTISSMSLPTPASQSSRLMLKGCIAEPLDDMPKNRRANLSAKKSLAASFPIIEGSCGTPRTLSKFLSQPAGMHSVLNTKVLQEFENIGDNVFRCTLPKIEILNFEVAPVVDLFVVTNEIECIIKMLSCKFAGSKMVEDQNERFSATLLNRMTWNKNGGQQLLDVNVELNVSLEVYSLPFTLLPISAVETPGNLVMQAMVDRLVPALIDQLYLDYKKWAEGDLGMAKASSL